MHDWPPVPGRGEVVQGNGVASRHPGGRAARRGASGCSSTCGAQGLAGYVLFDAALHPVLHGLRLPLDRAAGRLRGERGRRVWRCSCRSSRSSARAPRRPSSGSSRIRSTRGSSIRCRSSRACWPTSGSGLRSAPTRTAIPGILGYEGPALSEVDGRLGRSARGDVIEAHDGAQERERDRADPRERALVRARAPAAAGVLAARRDRGRGEPAGRPRGDARDAGGARRRRTAAQHASSDGASAGYRGQIGLRSSWAHAVAHNIEFQAGDVLVTETSAPIWGYNAELERAMIIGPPTDEMRRLFDHTVAAQQVAFDALRPGVTCADVDGAVMRYFEAERPAPVLAPAHRPRDRPAQPRGAVPRRRRPHADRAGHGLHDRAGSLRRRRSAASATRTRSSSPTTGSTSSPTTRATSRA